jgi:RimJ/RimL family protein N-acetyltransferase
VSELTPAIAAPLGDVTTERLLLRRFELGDLDDLALVFSNPAVWQFPFGRALTRTETQSFLDSQLREWQERGFGLWAARVRDSGRLIGYIGLSVPTFLPEILPAVEVGWRLAPNVWGFGYATEGATAALDQAFTTLGLAQVCSVPQRDNLASVRVAERLGMRRVRSVTIPPTDRRGSLAATLFEIEESGWRSMIAGRRGAGR